MINWNFLGVLSCRLVHLEVVFPRRLICCVTALGLSFGAGYAVVHGEQRRGSPTLTLALAGDVFIDAPTRLALAQRASEVSLQQAYRELLAEVAPSFERASLAIVNLETPISPRYRERAPGDPPIFNTSPHLLDALVDAGVDALTIANNHAYDQGIKGLQDTIAHAQQRKLPVVGVAESPDRACGPLLLKTPAGTVGLCTWSQSLNIKAHDAPDDELPLHVALTRDGSIQRCIQNARKRSDLALAAFHFTPSAWNGPTDEERQLVQTAVDAGADLVIGHGPHMPGPTAKVRAADGREALVVYSLGNLIGAMGRENDQWRSHRAGVRDAAVIVVETRRTTSRRLVPSAFDAVPFWISEPMPNARWWKAGQPLTRPLSIRAELSRLARAKCGVHCEQQARGYHRRARIIATAYGVSTQLDTEAMTSPEPLDQGQQPEPELPPGADVALRSLLAGVTLPVSFEHNTVAGQVTDSEEIDRISRLLLVHRDLRIHLTGSAISGEDLLPGGEKQLGARRARTMMWLLSGKGPSRSRFVMSGEVSDRSQVTLRLSR